MRQLQAISGAKIMKTQSFKWNRCIAVLLGLSLFAIGNVHAQQQSGARPAGGGQGGGFGGGYGGGFNRTATTPQSGSANASQYNAAGSVGNATISVDPDTHNMTIIADDDTTKYIAQV